ncbi:MAG: hypothetical protein H6808_04950 [Phycisphaera sp.]|nr:hypothetical protein [Phycisphaera sp.]
MTHEGLVEIIESYNAGSLPRFSATRSLTPEVVVARVWKNEPTGGLVDSRSQKYYFVLADGFCVAVVYDMHDYGYPGGELHWLVLEGHRKRGYLHRALQSTIFPHMFQDDRKIQFATAKEPDAIRYAERQGFQRCQDQTYAPHGSVRLELEPTKAMLGVDVRGQNKRMSRTEIEEMKRRLRQAASLVVSVSETLELNTGIDKLFLDEVAGDLESARERLWLDYEDHVDLMS